MKKIIFVVVFVAITLSVTSCSSRKKGCGLTAEHHTQVELHQSNAQ